MFSESEVRFLLGVHALETASGTRFIKEGQDLAQLGCPERIFQRVLEDRARRLGSKFTQFRAAQGHGSAPAVDLDQSIEASKLF
jgi:hypothetical protein